MAFKLIMTFEMLLAVSSLALLLNDYGWDFGKGRARTVEFMLL
jgi:hypothetical protein